MTWATNPHPWGAIKRADKFMDPKKRSWDTAYHWPADKIINIRVDDPLLTSLDELKERLGFTNRSELIRLLLRVAVVEVTGLQDVARNELRRMIKGQRSSQAKGDLADPPFPNGAGLSLSLHGQETPGSDDPSQDRTQPASQE